VVDKTNNFDNLDDNNSEENKERQDQEEDSNNIQSDADGIQNTIERLKHRISQTNGRSKVGKNTPKSGADEDFHSTSEAPKVTEEEAQRIYDSESSNEPAMPVDIPLPTTDLEHLDIPGVQGLEEAISSGSDLTDMQWTGEKLFPSKWGGKYSKNNRMIGRLDPAVFLPVIHLNAVNRIMRTPLFQSDSHGNMVRDPKTGKGIPNMVDVNEIYMEEYTIASIELDGFGRGEALELAGAAREEKRMDRQFGGLAPGMG
jgi:hypothetical protein